MIRALVGLPQRGLRGRAEGVESVNAIKPLCAKENVPALILLATLTIRKATYTNEEIELFTLVLTVHCTDCDPGED